MFIEVHRSFFQVPTKKHQLQGPEMQNNKSKIKFDKMKFTTMNV